MIGKVINKISAMWKNGIKGRCVIIAGGVLLLGLLGTVFDEAEGANVDGGKECRTVDNPKFIYGACGIIPQRGRSGFDYCLGEYRIGGKEWGDKDFSRESVVDWTHNCRVFLKDGYVCSIMVNGEENDAESLEQINAKIEAKKTEYENRYGFKFRKAKAHREDIPHWVADVDADIGNRIVFHIYAITYSKDKSLRLFCMGIVANGFIEGCLRQLEGAGVIHRNTPSDLSLFEERLGRDRHYKTNDKWTIVELGEPIRCFTQKVISDEFGFVTRIQFRGMIVEARDDTGPVLQLKTIALIKKEMNELREIFERKYGLEFANDSNDPQWPRIVAKVNEKMFPDARLEIGRATWLSDDVGMHYHIAVTLKADKSIVKHYKKMLETDVGL